MYTEQELKKAADIIKKVAEDNNVSEDQVRADIRSSSAFGPISQRGRRNLVRPGSSLEESM